MSQCFHLLGKPRPNKGGAATSHVASNASALPHPNSHIADTRWNPDTGCTSHMTPDRARLLNARPYRVPILVANGVIIYSELVGDAMLRPRILGRNGRLTHGRRVILSHVLYVPLLSHNLISPTHLSRIHGYSVLMEGSVISFSRDGELLFEADIDERNQAFVREEVVSHSGSALAAVGPLPLDLGLLHRRLGHHSDTQLHQDCY